MASLERIHEIEELRRRKEITVKKNLKDLKEEREFFYSKKQDKTAQILGNKKKKRLELDGKAID